MVTRTFKGLVKQRLRDKKKHCQQQLQILKSARKKSQKNMQCSDASTNEAHS